MLSYEIAAVQKAAFLGIKDTNPLILSSMGMGRVLHPGNLEANDYLSYIDTYNSHCHRKTDEEAKNYIQSLMPFRGDKPVWLTEYSTGSFSMNNHDKDDLPIQEMKSLAEMVPMIFARNIFRSVNEIFYFYFFVYVEVKGEFYGLARQKDLAMTPGYNAIAAVGRILGNAHNPEKLDNLPGFAEGYKFQTSSREKKTETIVLWTQSSENTFTYSVPEGSEIYDVIGRQVKASGKNIKLSQSPLFIVAPATVNEPVAKSFKPSPAASVCPIVMNTILADIYKNEASDYLAIPAEQDFTLPLDIYNFSDHTSTGSIKIQPDQAAGMTEIIFKLDIAPWQHIISNINLRFPRAKDSGNETFRLSFTGDFDKTGKSIMTINVKPVTLKLGPDDKRITMPNSDNPSDWHINIIAGSEMETARKGNWNIFSYDFKDTVNKVIKSVWAAPSLEVSAFSSAYPDAVAIDLKQIEGPKLKLAFNVVEENGSAYIGMMNVEEDALRSDEGATVVIPFQTMSNPKYRKQDDNGKLDLDSLKAVELAFWTEPNSKVTLSFKKMSWVYFSK
ncbi:MAG TPA: hypothetical protein DC049_10930 [Spirochaetia bacterium]|nr:hypothetical protein [Spirochaetia bacterium]